MRPDPLAKESLKQDPPRAPERMESIDTAKALAALAVVCLHIPVTGAVPVYWEILIQLCRVAVPFFSLAAGYFFARSLIRSPSIGAVIRKYVLRIGIVFAFWTLFYTIAPPFLAAHVNVSAWDYFIMLLHNPKCLFLSGGCFHLWFLSTLFRMLLVVAFCHWIGRIYLAVLFGLFQFVVGLGNGAYAIGGSHLLFGGGSCVYLFVAVGAMVAVYNLRLSARSAFAMFLAGIVIQLTEVFWLKAHYGISPGQALFSFGTIPFGVGLFLFTLSRPHFAASFPLHKIGKYALGVYVMHPYIAEVLRNITPLEPLFRAPIYSAVVVYATATVIAMVLARQRFLASVLK